ncbi:MAG: bacteriocin [Lachnospiraceae bacterium]|nr:bacteriocin [Lachnospiraceae bacterium]
MNKNLLIELNEDELENIDGGEYVCLPLYEMYGNLNPYPGNP